MHTSFSLSCNTWKSIRLKWGFKGAPFASRPLSLVVPVAREETISIWMKRVIRKCTHLENLTMRLCIIHRPRAFFELYTLCSLYVARLFYTLNNRLTYFNPTLLKILGSNNCRFRCGLPLLPRCNNFFNEKKTIIIDIETRIFAALILPLVPPTL